MHIPVHPSQAPADYGSTGCRSWVSKRCNSDVCQKFSSCVPIIAYFVEDALSGQKFSRGAMCSLGMSALANVPRMQACGETKAATQCMHWLQRHPQKDGKDSFRTAERTLSGRADPAAILAGSAASNTALLRWAHSPSCSVAAALKVSPATSITCNPATSSCLPRPCIGCRLIQTDISLTWMATLDLSCYAKQIRTL